MSEAAGWELHDAFVQQPRARGKRGSPWRLLIAPQPPGEPGAPCRAGPLRRRLLWRAAADWTGEEHEDKDGVLDGVPPKAAAACNAGLCNSCGCGCWGCLRRTRGQDGVQRICGAGGEKACRSRVATACGCIGCVGAPCRGAGALYIIGGPSQRACGQGICGRACCRDTHPSEQRRLFDNDGGGVAATPQSARYGTPGRRSHATSSRRRGRCRAPRRAASRRGRCAPSHRARSGSSRSRGTCRAGGRL